MGALPFRITFDAARWGLNRCALRVLQNSSPSIQVPVGHELHVLLLLTPPPPPQLLLLLLLQCTTGGRNTHRCIHMYCRVESSQHHTLWVWLHIHSTAVPPTMGQRLTIGQPHKGGLQHTSMAHTTTPYRTHTYHAEGSHTVTQYSLTPQHPLPLQA